MRCWVMANNDIGYASNGSIYRASWITLALCNPIHKIIFIWGWLRVAWYLVSKSFLCLHVDMEEETVSHLVMNKQEYWMSCWSDHIWSISLDQHSWKLVLSNAMMMWRGYHYLEKLLMMVNWFNLIKNTAIGYQFQRIYYAIL